MLFSCYAVSYAKIFYTEIINEDSKVEVCSQGVCDSHLFGCVLKQYYGLKNRFGFKANDSYG